MKTFLKKLIPSHVKEQNLKFFRITQWAYTVGILAHSSAIVYFGTQGYPEMMWFNVLVSVPCFVTAWVINRRGYHNLAFAFGFFELFVHQMLGAYFLGAAAGWYFWLIYLAALSFFNPHWGNSVHFLLLACIIAGFLVMLFFFAQGVYPVKPWLTRATFINNALSCLVLLSLLINYYSRAAHKAEAGLRDAVEQLYEKNEEIETQQERIVQSIHYAKVIQNAVLPTDQVLTVNFPAHFILFQPTGIVSGDFYWFSDLGKQVVVVCADCTGHGVPGGFMSMLGISYLSELVNHQRVIAPAQILEGLRQKMKDVLKNDHQENQPKDGMDVSVCTFDKTLQMVQFAGANNGIFVVNNGQLVEHKPTKNPIGMYPKEIPFVQSDIGLEPNTRIYMYTDGYIDQFGGPQGKKFLKKRLKDALLKVQHLPMLAQKQALHQVFENWRGDSFQVDDCTLIGLNVS
ncbi:PP2C family protein-serine/threonine phosphatase [Microscilla marina]|uniref:Serine/threonine protein kinases n=1 Tax=Microscilla marina ATCC 23134 TaxID=313606 RepID=A1ZNK7_MICM2|nr:SpoIIE family protein phosphatase [Microscilla marina]EAY28118.1 serine/threonine protein kinases [Microscilla marina ATCC 23134]